MPKIFFLIPIDNLGPVSRGFKNVDVLWNKLNTDVEKAIHRANVDENIPKSNIFYPKVYVNVNLYDGAKNMSLKARDSTLEGILKAYPTEGLVTKTKKTVILFGFGTTDQGNDADANRNIQQIGAWAKLNGFHSIKSSIHPDAEGPNKRYCFRDTEGFPRDRSKYWCPVNHRTRLMTWIMGNPMRDLDKGFPDIATLAKRFKVDPNTGNGQIAPTIVVSDRPLLDTKFADYNSTEFVNIASQTDRY